MATATRAPHAACAAIMGTYLSGLAAAGVLARLLGRDPEDHRPIDLVVLGVAAVKAARAIARDEVTSFIRDPFVESGHLRQALGVLVTCTRCTGRGWRPD